MPRPDGRREAQLSQTAKMDLPALWPSPDAKTKAKEIGDEWQVMSAARCPSSVVSCFRNGQLTTDD
jgi:hypothetical protein